MIDKNKTYTYEELEKIIIEAQKKTLDKLEKDTHDLEGLGKLLFTMQSMAVIGLFMGILLEGEEDESSSN